MLDKRKKTVNVNDLDRIKNTVRNAHEFFRPNYESWHKSRNFLFRSQISKRNKILLADLNKPDLQFNVLAPYVSRLRGEFSKQEPSISVSRHENVPMTPLIGQQINIVEGYVRHILNEANKNGCEYNVYTDQLSGGFSVIKVWTEYADTFSFEQVIRMDRVYDPTLCGFDPLARLSHKGDGRFCFEIYPKSKDEFEEEYPDVDISTVKFDRGIEGFSWAYRNEKEDVLMICDYYEKKKESVTILQLTTGEVILEKKYKKLLKEWEESEIPTEPPKIKKKRQTEVTTICRTRLIDNQILEYVETDYKHLPLVFVDGNSVLLRENVQSNIQQYTKSYFHDAIGAQKLKNYAGQSWASYMENMVTHKWLVPVEAIVEDYKGWITKPQIATAAVYRAFHNDDPDKPIPSPREIGLTPMPQEISTAFQMADQAIQNILGSYDAALGINNNQLSGTAIVEAATQSNSAAMPYIVSFLQALGQCAEIIVDLLPKYIGKEPRTIPILDKEGNKTEARLNYPGSINLKYPENALQVKVEAGVNFGVQKNRALSSMISLMQASPRFAAFMNEEGLPELLDNVEFRGIDILKEKAKAWQQKQVQMQAQQAQMAQMAMQNDPRVILAKSKQAEVQNDIMKTQAEIQHRQIEDAQTAADQAIQAQRAENERLSIMSDMAEAEQRSIIAREKMDTEKMGKAVDLSIAASRHAHDMWSSLKKHHRDDLGVIHKVLTEQTKNGGMTNATEER